MKIGDTLAGRYEVRATLGAGGLGEVLVARDTRSRRDVAVKVFDPARCPADRLAAMATLLAAASRVDHPALVLPKIQVGLSERPPFVVSELIPGEDLAARLAREKCVPWQRALALVLTCAEGLAAAAKATGRPHGALKPGNIRVTPNGEARVLDYGIGELGTAEPPRPRSDGSFAEYRAPEQIQGAPLDARTDVFALGVLLFELLTGVHPFTGSTAHKAAWKVSMPTLSVQPSELAPATPLPSQVEKLLVRALARAPADRFKDLTDMAHHLALVLRSPGAPIRARGLALPASPTTDDRTQTLPAVQFSEDMTTAVSLPVVRQPRPVAPPQPATAHAAPLQAEPERPGSAEPPSPPSPPPPSSTPRVVPQSPPRPREELPPLADDERTEILPARRPHLHAPEPTPLTAPNDSTLVLEPAPKTPPNDSTLVLSPAPKTPPNDSTLVLSPAPKDSTLVLDPAQTRAPSPRQAPEDDEITAAVASMTRRRPPPPALADALISARETQGPAAPSVSPAPAAPSEPCMLPATSAAAPTPGSSHPLDGKLLWINAICLILIAVFVVLLLAL